MAKDTLTKTGLSKAADEFVNQYTRHKMVDWCVAAVRDGTFKEYPESIYLNFALEKKWVSLVYDTWNDGKKTYKVLSLGFQTAARFLKR